MNRQKIFASFIALAFLGIQFGTAWFIFRDSALGPAIPVAGALVAAICLHEWRKRPQYSWRACLGMAVGLACLTGFFCAVDVGLAMLIRLFSATATHGKVVTLATMFTGATIGGATSSALRAAIIAKLA